MLRQVGRTGEIEEKKNDVETNAWLSVWEVNSDPYLTPHTKI